MQRFRMDGIIDYRYTYRLSQYTIFNKMENSAIVLPKSSRLNNLEYILARSTSNRMVLPRHQHLKMLNGKTVSQKTNSKVSSNHHTTKTIHLFVTSKQIGSENMSKSLNIHLTARLVENTMTIRFIDRPRIYIAMFVLHRTYMSLKEQCSKNCSMHSGLKIEK